MIVADATRETPEYLALIAMLKSGIYDEETYSRAEHWNDLTDEIHTFWNKFEELLEFCDYEITDKTRSCKNCRFSSKTEYKTEYNLYKCLNTEIDMRSHNTEKFSCSKWKKRD